jgi:hypothetical protein
MGSDHGAIDIMHIPVQLAMGVGLGLHCREELLPDASPLPAVEAAGDRAPRAIALGQIPPGSPGAQNPENAIEDTSMINSRSTGLGFLWREQRLEPLPLRIGQVSSVHTHQYNDVNRVCKHTLVLQW